MLKYLLRTSASVSLIFLLILTWKPIRISGSCILTYTCESFFGNFLRPLCNFITMYPCRPLLAYSQILVWALMKNSGSGIFRCPYWSSFEIKLRCILVDPCLSTYWGLSQQCPRIFLLISTWESIGVSGSSIFAYPCALCMYIWVFYISLIGCSSSNSWSNVLSYPFLKTYWVLLSLYLRISLWILVLDSNSF